MSSIDDFAHQEVIDFVARTVTGHPSTLSSSTPVTRARPKPPSLNTSYTMSAFLLLVRALPPLVSVDMEFGTLYRFLAGLPHNQRVGRRELQEFGEEYSVITRVRQMKAAQDNFCMAMHAYLQARREAEEAAAEYVEETNEETEGKLHKADGEVTGAKAQLLARCVLGHGSGAVSVDVVIRAAVLDTLGCMKKQAKKTEKAGGGCMRDGWVGDSDVLAGVSVFCHCELYMMGLQKTTVT
ncbi:hypothetical protein LXA43DRAFT_1069683 [Ganoderma leucocontextum]|nr:hypothetical protein LXA43DRAFT_1069683 [Ganoderma leucocontextum]